MTFLTKDRLGSLLFLLASIPMIGASINAALLITHILKNDFSILLFFIQPFRHSFLGSDGGLAVIYDFFIVVFFEILLIIGGVTILLLMHFKKEEQSKTLKLIIKIFVVSLVFCILSIFYFSM